MEDSQKKQLKTTLMRDAHALSIPIGAAESFVNRSISAAEKSLKGKKIITEDDLNRAIVKELKKYHTDLAYVYKNRGKII